MKRGDRHSPRVLFFNPSLYALGGMQAWLAALMPDLDKLGWESWLALPVGRFNDARAYLANYPWPRVRLLENRAGTKWGRERAVREALRQIQPEVVVVANLPTVYEVVERLRWMGRPSPRVLMCTHTFDEGIFGDLRRFAPVIDGFIAPNRLTEVAARKVASFPSDRIRYASYGVDLPEATPWVPNRSLEIVFCSRLEQEQKRCLDLPKIADGLKRREVDFRLMVVGGGPDEARLRAAVTRSSAADRIELLGPVEPGRVVNELFRPGRVLLVTSAWENGPIVLWQAAANRLAIVASRFVGSGREATLVDGADALMFQIGDVEGAAAALARLVDLDLRRRLAAAASEMAARRYGRSESAMAWNLALTGLRELPLRRIERRPRPIPDAGRLDRWLGLRGADLARRILRRPAHASGPGDEWPHTTCEGGPASTFLAILAKLDEVPWPEIGPAAAVTERPGFVEEHHA